MKRLILLFTSIFLVSFASAQDDDWELDDWSMDELVSDTRGFSLSFDLNGSSIELTNTDVSGPEGSGGGLGLGASYGLNHLISLIVDVDAANVRPNVGNDYTLGHLDLGIVFNLLQPDQPFRPFLGLAVTGRSAKFRIPRGDAQRPVETTASGPGVSLIAGLHYFASRSVSIDGQLVVTPGTFNSVSIPVPGGTLTQDIDLDSTTGRVKVGVSWFVSR